MKLRILAPHQNIEGLAPNPGEEVEVPNRTIARNLIASGYAVEVETGGQLQGAEPAPNQGDTSVEQASTRKARK